MFKQFIKSGLRLTMPTTSILFRRFSRTLAAVEKNILIEHLTGKLRGIAVLSLNRRKANNAFDISMIADFEDALDIVEYNEESRVLVIRSSCPDVFSPGVDMQAQGTLSSNEQSEVLTELRGIIRNLEELAMPVIAAIDGSAMCGGLEMALACDIRVAATTAQMALLETRQGSIPFAGGTQRLPRLSSTGVAKELIFTSRVIDGKEAQNVGMVNHVVPQNHTKDAAFQKALEIAAEILPSDLEALRMAKMAIDRGSQVDLLTGYTIEDYCYSQLNRTKDHFAALDAFTEGI